MAGGTTAQAVTEEIPIRRKELGVMHDQTQNNTQLLSHLRWDVQNVQHCEVTPCVMLLLPYGCFNKSPQARLALGALKHLFIIFFHAAGRVPGRISKKYNMQNLLQVAQEIRRGISLFHREESTLILLVHLGKCYMFIKLYLNSQNKFQRCYCT